MKETGIALMFFSFFTVEFFSFMSALNGSPLINSLVLLLPMIPFIVGLYIIEKD